MKRSLIAAVLACAVTQAAAFDATDRAAVETLTADFGAAFEAGDMAAVIGFIPPAMIEHIAEQNSISADVLKSMMIRQTEQIMAEVTVEGFDMDLNRMRTGTTPAGRDYALVPTTTSMSIGGPAITTQTTTLFLEDDSTWVLLRIETAEHIRMVKAIYPDFQGLDLQ